jgi:hypothetical protein
LHWGAPVARRGPHRGPSVASTGSAPANRPTRRRAANTRAVSGSGAKRALVAELLAAAQERIGMTETRSDRGAFRYLESSRLLVPPPAPLDPAEQHKLTQDLADLVADVIAKVLDGLGLSDADWERGRNLAMEALSEVTRKGWSPL